VEIPSFESDVLPFRKTLCIPQGMYKKAVAHSQSVRTGEVENTQEKKSGFCDWPLTTFS
jgi:hypothetical protein